MKWARGRKSHRRSYSNPHALSPSPLFISVSSLVLLLQPPSFLAQRFSLDREPAR